MENSQGTSDGSIVNRLKRNLRCCSSCLVGLALLAGAAMAQPALRLKGLVSTESKPVFTKTRRAGWSHLLVQFATEPDAAQRTGLVERGAPILSYVPDSALSISIRDGTSLSGLGIQWQARLQPSQKLNPELNKSFVATQAPPVLVEFYSDVPEIEGRAIALEAGVAIHDNPDLLPHHLLIEGTADQVRRLADWDEVSYIFPASRDLIRGLPVHACAGALTTAGPVGQAVPLVGDGWDGPGLGSASLNYAFGDVTGMKT